MRKSSFLSFCFAFIPGAGQMYLGMTCKGAVIMSAFTGCIAIGSFFRLGFLIFFLPVLWFYSFFDTFNLRHLPYEQLLELDKRFGEKLVHAASKDWGLLLKKRHLLLGVTLMVAGSWMLLEQLVLPLLRRLNLGWLLNLLYRLPTILIAFVIIALGIYLVKGKKINAPIEDEFVAYKGEDHE